MFWIALAIFILIGMILSWWERWTETPEARQERLDKEQAKELASRQHWARFKDAMEKQKLHDQEQRIIKAIKQEEEANRYRKLYPDRFK